MPSSFAPRFDPWNSSSTGHQQAPDGKRPRRSTEATNRLAAQFRHASSSFFSPSLSSSSASSSSPSTTNDDDDDDNDDKNKKKKKKNNLFAGVVVYIDGCTAPLVSDHRLRCLLVSHGATLATRLARRVVTHVVLSTTAAREGGSRDAAATTSTPTPSTNTKTKTITPRNALSASKVEAELRRRRVAGVRYVDVRWVLESINAGKRLPETRFPALTIGTSPPLRFTTNNNT